MSALSGFSAPPQPDLRRLQGAGPTRRPRILHVFPNFDVGGVQVRFAALVAAFGDRYHHTVVSLGGGYEAAALIPPDQPVVYAEPFRACGGLARRLLRHRTQVAGLRPDLLVTYNWGSMEVALANAAGRTPHLHMEDGFGPEEAHGQLARRVWTRRLALARSQVVVPSATLHAIATRRWGLRPQQVHHIPNGLPPHAGKPGSGVAPGPVDPAGKPWIAWVGALRPEKNPLRLLRAFAPLRAHARLLLVGDGPEREAVMAEAARLSLGDSLRIVGHRQDARDLVGQADLLALSSDTEQMPFAVLEAMDAGLPVASTDVGDVRQMVAAENRPFIVPPSDENLGGALWALVSDPALRARIGGANRSRVRNVYSLERMAAAHGALLDRLLGTPRPERTHA